MSWVKIDDGLPEHEKFASLSDSALALWLKANCWCHKKANQVTCGFIPERKVVEYCGGSKAKAKRLAKELVNARGEAHYGHEHGLWHADEGGWRFHDWSDYRPELTQTPEQQDELSKKRSEAGKRGAKKRWGNRQADSPRDSKVAIADDGKTDSKPTSKPDGIPDPVTRYPLPKEEIPPNPPSNLQWRAERIVAGGAKAQDTLIQYGQARQWPETRAVIEAFEAKTGQCQDVRTDSDGRVKAILGQFKAGYSLAECIECLTLALQDDFWRTKGLQAILSDTGRLDSLRQRPGGPGEPVTPEDTKRRARAQRLRDAMEREARAERGEDATAAS